MRRTSDNIYWQIMPLSILLIIIVWFIASCSSSNAYNNGICKICGGNYEFYQAIGHHYTTNYLYECDKCGNIIEVNQHY